MKNKVKKALFDSGLVSIMHKVRNRHHLTTVMFHRVLPANDPRSIGANESYTITPDEFDQCLSFFQRHYNVISLEQLRGPTGSLPARPLLITFDDGWQDNLQYAAPVLRKHDLPAVLFVASGAIGSDKGFWQEDLLDRYICGSLNSADHQLLCSPTDLSGKGAAEPVIQRLAKLPEGERADLLGKVSPREKQLPRQMATAEELHQMQEMGWVLGGHGHSHDPMTEVMDPTQEAGSCQEILQKISGTSVASFSFPHGRYNEDVFSAVKSKDFILCFTSDEYLPAITELSGDRPIGRIEINLRHWRDNNGQLDMPAFALNLFTQPKSPPVKNH